MIYAFAGMFLLDMCYAFYTKAVVKHQHIRASAWAAIMPLFMGIVTLAYVHEPMALLSAMGGAFAGTLVGSMIK